MPAQQQMSSFAKKMGARVAQANAEHASKPVDTGNRRLPGGIRDGVAKLSTMYTKEQDSDGGMVPRGETFFRASAIVMTPESHNGEKVAGMVTQVLIPLCDTPAKGQRKGKSFSEHWFEFQNLFKLLGIAPCPETPQTDPTGQRTEAYFFAAMKMLTDPVRLKTNPVYVSFSTRGWTPPASPQQPKPEEIVFETWHGLAQPPSNGQHNPAASVTETPSAPPPVGTTARTEVFNEFAAPERQVTITNVTPMAPTDPADLVSALVEAAMNDPDGATDDGVAASSQLEDMAWAAGWTKEQTMGAKDWAAVGDMVLNPPNKVPPTNTAQGTVPSPSPSGVAIGSKWKFAKRTKEGAKLKNNKGEEFPPQDVEVVTVDAAAKTCTLKTTKDGKDVVDIRTKAPINVKFEWLE